MWTIGRTFLAAALFTFTQLTATPFAAALPVKSTPGSVYCRCNCGSSAGVKELSWSKVSSCSVNTHSCTFQDSNGLHPGKLNGCEECTAQASGTEWRCVPVPLSHISPALPGQLPQLQVK